MDAQEIRTLLGKNIFERAQKYRKRILQSSCTTNEDGVRHLTALVQGSGPDCYYTQVWLRENGSFVSASCDCPYNQNGDGTYCKHIGLLLLLPGAETGACTGGKAGGIPGSARRGGPCTLNRHRGTVTPPGWICCLAKSGTAKSRRPITQAAVLLEPTSGRMPLKTSAPDSRPAHRLCSAGTGTDPCAGA